MNTCCDGFTNALNSAGGRGLAVVTCERPDGQIHFLFQSRGIAFDDQHKMHPIATNIVINESSETGLRFCPWCGQELNELVHRFPEYYRQLSTDHKKFVSSMLRMLP